MNYGNLITALSCLIVLTSGARAGDPAVKEGTAPGYNNGSVGLGANVESSTTAGTSASGAAQLSYFYFREGHNKTTSFYDTSAHTSDDSVPTIIAEGLAQYNVIGAGREGVTTGLSAHARVGVMKVLKEENANGCTMYFGVMGGGDGVVSFQNRGANGFDGFLGPETGFWCQLAGSTVFTISPSVQVGKVVNTHGNANDPQVESDWLVMGGRARLMVNNKFYASLEGQYLPSLTDKARTEKPQRAVGELRFIAEYKIDQDWAVNAHVTAQADTNPATAVDPAFLRIEGGAAVKRVF